MLPWIHPTLVHFAIGLLFAAVLFDVVGLWRSNEKLLFAGFWNTILGAVGALASTASGLLAESRLGVHDDLGGALLPFHETLGFVVTVLSLVLAGSRIAMKGYIRPRLRTLYLSVAFLTAGFALLGGALGGALVYGYGLGITPQAAQRVLSAQPAPALPAPASMTATP